MYNWRNTEELFHPTHKNRYKSKINISTEKIHYIINCTLYIVTVVAVTMKKSVSICEICGKSISVEFRVIKIYAICYDSGICPLTLCPLSLGDFLFISSNERDSITKRQMI